MGDLPNHRPPPLTGAEDDTHLFFRMFVEINIIASMSQNRLQRELPEGMSMAQFGVLGYFVRTGEKQSSPGKLAQLFQVTKGAMTNTLQRLEAQGFVRIVADPNDARGKVVEITDAGRAVREHAVKATGAAIKVLTEHIKPAEVRAALPFLEHLRVELDAARQRDAKVAADA